MSYYQPTVSLVARPKLGGLLTHYGNRVDDVVQDFGPRGFRRISVQEFAAGQRVRTIRQVPPHQTAMALQRLNLAVDARWRYGPLSLNCQHAATWAMDGIATSDQSDAGAWVLGLAMAGALLRGLAK